MVRIRKGLNTIAYVADGIDEKGRRRRLSFKSPERAKEFEDAVLRHSQHLSIGTLFPELMVECWPPGTSRDPSVEGRVRDLVVTLGRDLHIRSIDDAKVEELERKLLAKGNSINTVANKLNTLSKILRRAKKRKLIDAMPEFEVHRDNNANRTFVLTPEQEDTILRNLPERWQPFAMFLIDTASRGFKECSHLEWHHVDFHHRTVSFWYNKTDKPRTVKLTADALAILRSLKDQGWSKPWAVLGTEGMSYRMWNHFWDKACRAAGLPREGRGAVVPYTCRHTTATRHARNGMDVLKLADLLGHSNLSTTRRYVHQDAEDQDPFVKKIERKRKLTA